MRAVASDQEGLSETLKELCVEEVDGKAFAYLTGQEIAKEKTKYRGSDVVSEWAKRAWDRFNTSHEDANSENMEPRKLYNVCLFLQTCAEYHAGIYI